MPAMRAPESQEHFDDSISTGDKTEAELWAAIEASVTALRREAADLAKEWLLKHGYFNGALTNEVFHYPDLKQVNVQVTCTCFGLPNATEDDT